MSKKEKKPNETPAPPGEPDAPVELTAETEATKDAEVSAATPPPNPDELLAASRAEALQNWDLYLRARADLDNYRKRAQREKEDLSRFGNENLLRELLPVLDNLERALDHARQGDDSNGSLLQGVEMTLSQLRKALEKFGAVAFTSIGASFDPARHEAMGQQESADQAPNTVIQELQKGYMLNDRLLRPAMVMISKAPAPADNPS